jgi:hypothetical protein
MPLPWLLAQGKGHDHNKKIVPFFRQFSFGFVIPYQVYSQLKFILNFQDWGGVCFYQVEIHDPNDIRISTHDHHQLMSRHLQR